MGDKNQPQVVGPLRRLHYGPGDHPSGSPQQVHAGNGEVAAADLEIGRISSIDDPDIAQKAIDFMVDKYGEASFMDFGDLWLGPDGRMAEVGWHAKAAVQFLEASNSELLSNYGGEKTLRELEIGHATDGALVLTKDLIERGLIRVKIKPGHNSVTIQGSPPLTRRQARTIQDIIAMMPKERRELLGRTGFQWEFKKPEERIIFGRTSGYSVVDFYRAAGIVERHYGPGPHPSESDSLAERAIMPDYEIDVDDIDHGWASAFKDEGIYTTPVEPIDGIIALPIGALGLSPKEPVSPVDESEPESEKLDEAEKKSLLADVRRALGDLVNLFTKRHYGPGPHPGTGTEQTVHAVGNGTSWKWSDDKLSKVMAFIEEEWNPVPVTLQNMDWNFWLLPDGRIIDVNEHAEVGPRLYREFGDELFKSEYNKKWGSLHEAELIAQGFVRTNFHPNPASGIPTIFLDLNQDMLNRETKQAITDMYWWAWTDRKMQPNVILDWQNDAGEFGSIGTSSLSGNATIEEVNREIGFKIDKSMAVNRHYGPGPHPSGSDQDVHGKGNGGYKFAESKEFEDGKLPLIGTKASVQTSTLLTNFRGRGADPDWVNVEVTWFEEGDKWVAVEILSGPAMGEEDDVAVDEWISYAADFDEALDTGGDPEENAIQIFGLTESYPEAGYILSDGDLLDFSGRNQGSGGGSRMLDHRDIGQAFPEDYEYSVKGSEGSNWGAMVEFMALGNIRMNFSMYQGTHDVSFDIAKLPTSAQKRVMRDMTQGAANLTWDITDPETGQEIASAGGSYPEDRELAEMFEAAVRKLVGRSLEFRYFTLRIRTDPEIERHGKHVDQEGRKGEKGGSAPGYTHADGAEDGAPEVDGDGVDQKAIDALAEQIDAERFAIEDQQEAIELAAAKLTEAEGIEPLITQMLEEIRREIGGDLTGLESKLKGQAPLARKILSDMEKDGISLEEAKGKINDANRYTFLFESGDYVESVLDTQETMAEQGWTQYDMKWKNFFRSGDGYDGYNTVMVNEEGERFELQFHTPESIKIKSEVHPMYEEFRVLPEGAPERKELFEKMQGLWGEYEKPNGWENLPGRII